MESVPQEGGINHHDAAGAEGGKMDEGRGGGEEKRKEPVEGAKNPGSSDPSSASSIPDYER